MFEILSAMDGINDHLAEIDKAGKVRAWAQSNSYPGSRNEIARWILAAHRELGAREAMVRELVRRLTEKDRG